MTTSLPDSAKLQSPFSFLYTRIALAHLGDTAAIIISTLISYGRLTAKDLHTRSQIPLKQVKSALVCLIQLNCISYWSDLALKSVFYSFNETGIKTLLHAGDIILRITTVYGNDAAEFVQNIVENGNLTVREYVSSLGSDEQKYEKMTLLVQLYNDGWLRRLQPVDYSPLEDVWNKLYTETLKNTPRSATTSEVKRVAEAKEKTQVKFTDLYQNGNSLRDVIIVEDGVHKLRPEITVTLSLSRYEKYLRSRALLELANSRIGLITSAIYAKCCQLVEAKLPDLQQKVLQVSGLFNDPEELRLFSSSVENALVDNKDTVFSLRDVARILPQNLDLRNSILTQNFLKPKRPHDESNGQPAKKVKLEDGALFANGNIDDDSFDHEEAHDDGSAHSLSLVAEHLKLLASSNVPFLVEVAPGSYTIPFMQITPYIKRFHYEMLVKTTLGANSLRVLKCIQLMKLADEKAILNAVLLKDRTVKSEIYKLVNLNVIEIQELPRSADRAALKTFFLFRHKEKPLYRYLSFALVYAMAETLTNITQFKLEHKILLEKCEREDVKGNEDELLLESELKTLRDLQHREVSNLGRFNRTKWLYVVFGVL